MENHFALRLAAAVRRCGNPVLVGLDPRAESLPAGLLAEQDQGQPERVAAPYGEFCRGVIDVVAPLVAVVKPQAAFFEQQGPAGMAVLAMAGKLPGERLYSEGSAGDSSIAGLG